MIHKWRPLWGGDGGGGGSKNDMVLDVGGGRGFSECTGRLILIFLSKKIGFALWPDIMLSQILIYYWQEIFLLTLTSDSEAIPSWYHCIFCVRNRTIERVVNLNATWLGFVFCFDFVPSHARCGCCSIVSLRFQVVQKNRLIAKWVLKMWIIINERYFVIFLGNSTHSSIKSRKSS